MRTKEEMIAKYKEIYKNLLEEKDPYKMENFGQSTMWLFIEIAGKYPDLADNYLSHLESAEWYNFLSQREMMNIDKRTVNQDGTRGFHWSYDTLKSALKDVEGKMEDYPYYHCYAMATVMNTLYSDHAVSVAQDLGYKDPKEAPNGRMAMSFYKKAIEKLKDVDNQHFVRKYFSNKMYDDSPIPK